MTVVPSPRARRAAGIGGAAAEEEFAQQIADALGYLHDVPRLQTHVLARRIRVSSEPTDGLGRALQQTLLDAIEKLRPARHGPPERAARIHRLLVSRYIDGLEPSAVWTLLGIGKSEYYREHSRGVAAVGAPRRE